MDNYKKLQMKILQEQINKYDDDLKKNNDAIKEKAALKSLHENYNIYAEAALKNRDRLAEGQRFVKWSDSVRENMLFEFIMNIFEPCTDKILNEKGSFNNLKCNLVQSFIKENGSAKLLKDFKKNSYFLSEAALMIENAHKKVVSSVDPKDKEYVIDTLVKQDFFDKINMSNVDGLCNVICNKVKDSIEDFVATNNDNRAKIAKVLNDAKAKIEGSADDSIKESINIISNNKIRAIENSPSNILGEMVVNMCKNLYKLPVEERATITQKDGKLNMEQVVESCKCIYTFLEMLATTRMHNFTIEELTNIIKDVGK